MRYANWNQSVSADVEQIRRPRDAEEVADAVAQARLRGKRLKAVGAGHSFNDLPFSDHVLVDLSRLPAKFEVDLQRRTCRVSGGVPLQRLIEDLAAHGLALANVGAWTKQTVAGVLSTATHGTSGRYRQTLIESVRELRLVDGLGRRRVLRGDDLRFLTLGYFGVITEVVLQCQPLFHLRQANRVLHVADIPFALRELLAQHDFVDLRWVGSRDWVVARCWDRVETPPGLADHALRGLERLQLSSLNGLMSLLRVEGLPAAGARGLFGVLGRQYLRANHGVPRTAVWHEALTFNSGVAAPHHEREMAVPMVHAEACIQGLHRLLRRAPESASIEVQVRFSPGVDVALAPHQGRDTLWFNLNMLDPGRTAEVEERATSALFELGGRPHWAKGVPARTPAPSLLYGERAREWERRRADHDPEGVFLNAFYERHFAPDLATTRSSRGPGPRLWRVS